MIALQSPLSVRELVELVAEIAEVDGVNMRTAFLRACEQLPSLLADIQHDARFVPSKVVMFTRDGRPTRVPNLMTAEELLRFTSSDRDRRPSRE